MKVKALIEGILRSEKSTRITLSDDVGPASAKQKIPLFDSSQFRIPSYGRSLSEAPNGKLVVFGLPKCGNVWLVSMLSDYLELPPIDPMVEVERKGVGMCHLPLDQVENRRDFIQAIYLMRDIRDVIVSYFHNCQTAWFKDNMPNFHYDDLESFYFEWFLPRVVPFHGIEDHAYKFTEAGIPIVRYERLCADTVGEFARIVKRLGLPFDAGVIEAVVEKNRLDALKKSGKQLNVFVPSTHFRRGGTGGYKNELPATVLRHVNCRFGRLLTDWGYELDDRIIGSAPSEAC